MLKINGMDLEEIMKSKANFSKIHKKCQEKGIHE